VVSSDGRLAFLGRSDDLMILGGTNVFAAEIEEVAKLFPGVNEAVAFAVRSPAHGDIPILAIADSDGVTEAALLAFCREQLGLRAPKQVVRLASIPRTEMGKPKRNELSADFERRLASNPSRRTRP
jgi:O-succinylbenzoic acid--CoA ligase